MRSIRSIILVVPVVLGCKQHGFMDRQRGEAAEALPHQPKGYELYSWSDGGDWCFTIVTGTNRLKKVDEIGPPDETLDGWIKHSVCGLRSLEALLERLPGGEEVLWSNGRIIDEAPMSRLFGYPDVKTINTIERLCSSIGVKLTIDR